MTKIDSRHVDEDNVTQEGPPRDFDEPGPEEFTTDIECSKCHEATSPENITSTGSYQDICIFCVEEEQLDDDEEQPNKNKALRYKK